MKKLILAAAFGLGLVPTSGCIFVSDDDPTGIDVVWEMSLDGSIVSCADVGVTEVDVTITSITSGESFTETIPCAEGGALFEVLPDDYDVFLEPFDADGFPAHDALEFLDQAVFDGEVTEIPVVEWAFLSDFRTLTFTVDYGDSGGSNCDDNGVVQQTIELLDETNDQCVAGAVLFGTDQEDMEFSADVCGQPLLCMENTVVQTIKAIPPAVYTLAITGYKGAVGGDTNACYIADYAGIDLTTGDDDLPPILVPFAPAQIDEAACNATKPTR